MDKKTLLVLIIFIFVFLFCFYISIKFDFYYILIAPVVLSTYTAKEINNNKK